MNRMTNAKKYLKDGVNTKELSTAILEFNKEHNNQTFYENMYDFWNSSFKHTLTEDEEVILRNIEFKNYVVIGRKESGDLYVNDKEKDSFNGTWFIMFKKHLFQFIQPRRRV